MYSKLEQESRGSRIPQPVPPPTESKGLMQNFDVKVEEQPYLELCIQPLIDLAEQWQSEGKNMLPVMPKIH